jgi:hypothetical protein
MPLTWLGGTTSNMEWLTIPQTFNNADNLNNGYDKVIISSDARKIYVSKTDGVAGNTGLSEQTPILTAAEAFNVARDGFPDVIYFDSRDDWTSDDFSNIKSGRSLHESSTLTSYGSGRALLPTVGGVGGGFDYIRFKQLHFYSLLSDPTYVQNQIDTDINYDPQTATQGNGFVGDNEGLVFEDNLFEGVEMNVVGDTGNPAKNFKVKRNIFTGTFVGDSNLQTNTVRPTNMYLDAIDGILNIENVFDYGGWDPDIGGQLGGTGTFVGAARAKTNHNNYLQFTNNGTRTFTKGNVFGRGASNGIQQRCGGVFEDNFAGRCAIGMFMSDGRTNELTYPFGGPTLIAEITNNVISEGSSMANGMGWETADSTAAVWGLDMSDRIFSIAVVQSMVVTLRDPNDTNEPFFRSFSSFTQEGNFIPTNFAEYHWNTLTQGDGEGYTDPTNGTLGAYYQKLVTDGDLTGSEPGDDNFDKLMGVLKERDKDTWNDKFSASAVNDFIRPKYNIPKYVRA